MIPQRIKSIGPLLPQGLVVPVAQSDCPFIDDTFIEHEHGTCSAATLSMTRGYSLWIQKWIHLISYNGWSSGSGTYIHYFSTLGRRLSFPH